MSEDLPHQHISGVSTQNHSQAFVGSARDVYFADSGNTREAPDQAARACRNGLFLTDPYVDRERVISAKGTRVAGTCEWIIRDEIYRAWLTTDGVGGGSNNDDIRLLWVSGGPGKGKTMMSVYLTEKLEMHIKSIDSAELLFYFCSARDEKCNTAVAVLRGLVHQIVSRRPQLLKHALPHFETPERMQQTLSSLETLWLIFSRLVADIELGTMFCVLDGLDECEESTLKVLLPRIVSFLTSKPTSTKGIFKLVVVSRDIEGLQGCARIRLDPDNNDKVVSDIELFVAARVDELSVIKGFDGGFRAYVQEKLLDRAGGTFLWVGFAMHELLQKQTCSDIMVALEELPSGLPAIYGRMLHRIPATKRAVSGAILRWVTLAVRPLQLDELATAVGIRAAEHQITITGDQATRDAVTVCMPLLKLEEQTVNLIHQSARDYLLREERDSDAVLEAFRIQKKPSHLDLARKCLDCLGQSSLQHSAYAHIIHHGTSPLLRYAMYHWVEHAKSCSALLPNLFDPYGLFLQKESSLRSNWWYAYRSQFYHGFGTPPLLHIACYSGIIPWVEKVLSTRSLVPRIRRRVNEKGRDRQTALHIAANRGNEALVRLLLMMGADVNAKDDLGRTPLAHTVPHNVVQEGNETVVRLMIEKGADVMAKDRDGNTALHSAARDGNEAVVRLLIDRGADIIAKNHHGNTVLHSAAWGGNEAVVRLLIERGADVMAKDRGGNTVLHSAAWGGNEAVVQLLIDRGADIMAKEFDGYTVLHSAAWGGNEAVVRLLIERGADIMAKDCGGNTVLHSAAWGGNEAVVRLLIDRGADIMAKDCDGDMALHSAARDGNEAVVRLLIEREADIMAKDRDGNTVLHSAAGGGNEAVVRLLIERGADIIARNHHGNTVLHFAVSGMGTEATVQILLLAGADIKARNSKGKTVLQCAATGMNRELVPLLMERGADIEVGETLSCNDI